MVYKDSRREELTSGRMVSFGALNSEFKYGKQSDEFDNENTYINTSRDHNPPRNMLIPPGSGSQSQGKPSEYSQGSYGLSSQPPHNLITSDNSKTSSSRALLDRI